MRSSAELMTDGMTSVSFKYDSDGMRTEKTVGSTTMRYVYNHLHDRRYSFAMMLNNLTNGASQTMNAERSPTKRYYQ